MTRRLLVSYLTVTLIVLLLLEVPLALFYAQREIERLTADVASDASVIATVYEDDLERGLPLDPRPAEEYEARTGARVVVVDSDGIARVDTQQPTPRDFSTRPEIVVALGGDRTSGTRSSDTLDTDLLYVALPVASGGVVHGALRVTLETSHVDSHVRRFWAGLVGIGAVVLGVMALIGWAVARSVSRPVRALNATATRFARGDLSVPDDHEAGDGPPELRLLADTMADMAHRLQELIDEQRAFVADASHQLRTPLTALRLRLENLQSRADEPTSAELDVAIDEISRLGTLVTDLLQLARADRSRTAEPTDAARLAADRVDTWSAMAESRQVTLRALGTENAAVVLAVPGALEQILDNVLDNAIAVAPPASEVTVRLDRHHDVRRIAVSDHGPGLSDEDKLRAVRRFWRGNPTAPGSGLGLAIATTLAEASGGSLRLTDTPGGGLTVLIELPSATDRSVPAR